MKLLLKYSLLVAIFLSLMSCKENITEQEVVNNAEQLNQDKKFNTSEIILKNFLSENPNSHDARELLAVTYAQQGSYTNAIAQFNRVETTLSNTGFTKFIESLYMSGQIDTLIETYEKYTASSLTPPLETKLVYALSKTRLSKEDKYISELATSLTESNKESLIGYLIQATANYQTTQDISSYLEGLKKATTKYPEYVNNWFYLHILSSIATAQTDHAYAADILKALLSLRPLDDKIRLFIAQELVRANKLSEAEVEVDKILRVFDNQPLANLLKAIILAAKNDLNAAKIHIERAINAGFETFNNYLLAGEINFLLNNYEQAISQLEKGLQGGTIRNRYYDMLIYARASTNNEKNIIDSIDKASITNMGQISNISSLLAGLNNSGKSASIASVVNNLTVAADADPIIALETSVFKIASSYDTAFPESIAASKLVLDRYQRGASDYTQAQIFAAKRFFLGELFEQERYEDAKKSITAWMQIDNDNASNRLFLAEVYNANKQYNETIKLLDAELNNLKTAQGFLLLAGAYFNLGQNDKALETIEFSLRKLKYNLALIKQFAELENSLEKNNETLILQVYADPEASLSDALFLHFYYAIKQQQDKAINVLLKLNTAQKDNILYWYTLAEAYLASGDNRAASSAANNLISTQAPTFSHFQSILSTFNKIGDVASTIKFIENNLSTFPGNDELSLYLADLYSKNGRAIEATKILDNISKQSETLAVAKAVNAVNLGKLNDAKALFESSMLEYGGVKTVIPYTNFLRNMANTEQAIRILNRFLEKQPDSTIVKNHLATMSGPEESMSIYRDILAGDPNNVIALNNLAWQLYLKGDYQAGFAFAEQAYAIMPEHKDVQNTYNKLKEKL